MTFCTGANPETDLTEDQILGQQCKMHIAALRIADDFGCDVIGMQCQQGLKDLAPASDLPEGLLNNVDRPPVTAANNGRVRCAGLDALVMACRTARGGTEGGYSDQTPAAFLIVDGIQLETRWVGKEGLHMARGRIQFS